MKPERAEKLVKINRKSAAQGQLEGAILLWFLQGDFASVHTLVVAAQTILHHVGSKTGKPSKLVEWIKSQPPAFQRRVVDAQNFFKHAHKDPDRVLTYAPRIAEIYIIDAIYMFEDLYHVITPLMRTFALRFSLSHPDVLDLSSLPVKFPASVKINQVAQLSRAEFFDAILPAMSRN